MKQSSNFNTDGNQTAYRFISYTLVFLMMTCFAMTIGILIRNAIPAWSSDIIAGIILFIAIDRLYMYKRTKTLVPFNREWALTLGVQWVVIVVFTKVLLSFADGPDSFMSDVASFTRGNFANLFDAEVIVTLLFALLVWYICGQFMELLDEVGLDQRSALYKASIPAQKDILSPHQRLVNLTIQLGVGLVVITLLTRINLDSMFNQLNGSFTGLNRFSGAETGVLFYFIFGFALFCLSRLMSLQTHWNRQQIPIASKTLAGQWGMYSAVFLLILIVVVGFLSSGNNLGLFSLLRIMFDFLFRTLFFIWQLIMFLFSLLISLPLLLLGKPPLFFGVPPPTPTPLPPEPTVESALPATNPNLALIRSILLWGALLVIVGFSVIRFVRQHGGLRAAFRKIPIPNWLVFVWEWLSNNADKTRRTLSRAVTDAWQSIVSRQDRNRLFPRPGWIRLNSLDPRRQIYFFYLAMIRRGREQGIARKPSQTPSEYEDVLERTLPTSNEDIHLITESFIEARYSPHDVDLQKVNLVKSAWKRLQRALQTKRP